MQGISAARVTACVRQIALSCLLGLACGLAYALIGLLLQAGWDHIELRGVMVTQIRFMQALIIGYLIVALAGFLPALLLRLTGREIKTGLATGAIAGAFAGIVLVLFDYLQHFDYFTRRQSLSYAGIALKGLLISPAMTALIVFVCIVIGAVSAAAYLKLDMRLE